MNNNMYNSQAIQLPGTEAKYMSYSRNVLIPFIKDMISENGHWREGNFYCDLSDLTHDDKVAFAAHCLKSDIDSNSELEWLSNTDAGSKVMRALTGIILAPEDKKELYFDAFFKECEYELIDFYKDAMNDYLEGYATIIGSEKQYENGMIPIINKHNGELYWTRRSI